jgi:hypothetical protein
MNPMDNNRVVLAQLVGQTKQRHGLERDDVGFLSLVSEEVLFDYEADVDEVENGIVDGSGDGGFDASYLYVNKILITDDDQALPSRSPIEIDWIIVTSQYRDGFAETVLTRMRNTFRDLLRIGENVEFRGVTYNDRLTGVFQRFGSIVYRTAVSNPRIRIRIKFATRASTEAIHARVAQERDNLIADINQSLALADADIEFLGAREIIELNRRVRTRNKNLRCAELISSENGDGYVALVTIDEVYSFLRNEQGSLQTYLFDANVRDFQGDNSVNSAIRATLDGREGAPEFWWFNNGATIVASRAVPQGKTLTLSDPLIVNGLQTSTVIYHYKSQNAEPDRRSILVRVIVPSSDEVRDRIIRATNQQTNIPPAFLRAMDKVHRDIEAYFLGRGLYYERRKNLYRNQGHPRENIVTIGELSQACVAALLRRPSVARARPNSIIQQDDQYQAIFSESIPLDVYVTVVRLLKRIEARLKESRITYPAGKLYHGGDGIIVEYPESSHPLDMRDRNNVKYHCLTFCVVAKFGPNIDYNRLAGASIEDAEIERACEACSKIYDKEGGSDQVAKSPEFQRAVLAYAMSEWRDAQNKEGAPAV